MALNDKHYLAANDFLRDVWRLAAFIRKADWKPDFLIALWRGGTPPGIAIHEFLKVSGWEVRHLPLKCASYTGIGENAGEVRFTCAEPVFGMLRKGDAEADELMELLLQVRADGVIEQDESDRIAWLLHEITVERPKRLRMEKVVAAGLKKYGAQ